MENVFRGGMACANSCVEFVQTREAWTYLAPSHFSCTVVVTEEKRIILWPLCEEFFSRNKVCVGRFENV
jgi:uncharacterized protein YbdZ (MbtH family)